MKHNKFIFKCNFCNIEFIAKQKRKRKFCCIEHFRKWSKGNINKKPLSLERKKKISNFQKNRKKGPNSIEHNKNISLARKGIKFSDSHREKMSNTRISKIINNEIKIFSSKQEKHFSNKTKEMNHSHSTYEKKYMVYLDNNKKIKYWTKNHKIVISYILNNKQHKYIPDFYLEYFDGLREIVEIKGRIFDEDKFIAKCESANKYCKNNNLIYRVLKKRDLEILNGNF